MPNYNLFHCDTTGHVQKHGIGVYVNNDTEVDQVTMLYKNIITLRLTRYSIFYSNSMQTSLLYSSRESRQIAALQAFIH